MNHTVPKQDSEVAGEWKTTSSYFSTAMKTASLTKKTFIVISIDLKITFIQSKGQAY